MKDVVIIYGEIVITNIDTLNEGQIRYVSIMSKFYGSYDCFLLSFISYLFLIITVAEMSGVFLHTPAAMSVAKTPRSHPIESD
jgi:hypothetical protein